MATDRFVDLRRRAVEEEALIMQHVRPILAVTPRLTAVRPIPGQECCVMPRHHALHLHVSPTFGIIAPQTQACPQVWVLQGLLALMLLLANSWAPRDACRGRAGTWMGAGSQRVLQQTMDAAGQGGGGVGRRLARRACCLIPAWR